MKTPPAHRSASPRPGRGRRPARISPVNCPYSTSSRMTSPRGSSTWSQTRPGARGRCCGTRSRSPAPGRGSRGARHRCPSPGRMRSRSRRRRRTSPPSSAAARSPRPRGRPSSGSAGTPSASTLPPRRRRRPSPSLRSRRSAISRSACRASCTWTCVVRLPALPHPQRDRRRPDGNRSGSTTATGGRWPASSSPQSCGRCLRAGLLRSPGCHDPTLQRSDSHRCMLRSPTGCTPPEHDPRPPAGQEGTIMRLTTLALTGRRPGGGDRHRRRSPARPPRGHRRAGHRARRRGAGHQPRRRSRSRRRASSASTPTSSPG